MGYTQVSDLETLTCLVQRGRCFFGLVQRGRCTSYSYPCLPIIGGTAPPPYHSGKGANIFMFLLKKHVKSNTLFYTSDKTKFPI